jgi:hypothetical protein
MALHGETHIGEIVEAEALVRPWYRRASQKVLDVLASVNSSIDMTQIVPIIQK